MTQIGGPAALNGFLYQIFHHLGWLANVSLTGQLDGQQVKDACLVLEPRGGGDARAEGSGTYIVEQYKSRAKGTWSLSDIESVLCDLTNAVPSSFPPYARYRFVTNGRPGKIDSFRDFLADIDLANGPDNLDNVHARKFRSGVVGTNQDFFDHLVKLTGSGVSQTIAIERTMTFHVLKHFEMEFCVSGTSIVAELEKELRQYAPDLGDERKIREQLVGMLLEELSKGVTSLMADDITDMFKRAGLNTDRLRNLAQLPAKMGTLTHDRLVRLQYQAERDVRGIPKWQEDKSVLLIAGESGVGKTWQLGRLLEARRDDGYIVTLVLAAHSREDLLLQASRDLWQFGLGETSEKTLVAVSNFLRELELYASAPGVIIGLDDVKDVDLARDLVRQDWAALGMCLVLTVSNVVAQALALTDSDVITEHKVIDFSVQELDLLLNQTGRRWADLPLDLKILLRRPILAGLFLELPYHSVQGAPRSEYEIFDRFWQRIGVKGKHGDQGVALALAESVCKGKPYPLAKSRWHEIGLSEEGTLLRLEAAGWLRGTENGEVAFAHDRLLNWAVAKWLARQFLQRELSVDDLSGFLVGDVGKHEKSAPIRLDYVPMDVVWLLAEDEKNLEAVAQLVALMDDSGTFGNYGEALYADLLPTLGQRAVFILRERLKEIIAGAKRDYRIGLIGKAFSKLAQQESVTLSDTVDSLLKAPSLDLQNVGLAVLTVAPSVDRLDHLWEMHQQRQAALAGESDRSRHDDYAASFSALRNGIGLDPSWLRTRILEADPEKEIVSDLGYLLNALEHSDASAIWAETKDVLIGKVSVRKPRALLYCIARFRDSEELDFVIQQLSRSEDFASSAALEALSVLDPKEAIDRLVEVGDAERYLSRNSWLPVLLRAQPEMTRKRFLELAESDFEGCRLIVNLFWERPDQLDQAMLDLILRTLENELRSRLGEALAGDTNWLYHPFDFLGRIADPELLEVLERQAGHELERMITKVACSRLRTNSNYRDPIRENARRVLILMAGEGIATLIERELGSEHFWVRHGGLNWAITRDSSRVVEKLAAIASRPLLRDAEGNVESEYSREYFQSTQALAALGADETLVEVLRNSAFVEVSVDLAQLRAQQGAMPKALTAKTLEVLNSVEPADDLLLTELTIAWLSGDDDLIPPVRTVLEQADPNGRIAVHACIALQGLGDTSDEFAKLADRMLHTEANSGWGLRTLVWLGNQGSSFLANWLKGHDPAMRNDEDESAIRALYDNPATRDLSISLAVERCRSRRFHLSAPYDIAAEASDPKLREQIFDKAFAAHSSVTMQQLRGIEGLAKFDVQRAVEAVELGLRNHPKIARQLCELLVRIAPQRAATQLVDAAVSIERKGLTRVVGQVLRRLESGDVSHVLIGKMSGLVSERKAAAEVAGWLPTPEISEGLDSLAEQDSANEIRLAALEALELHQREAGVRTLLAAFPTATLDRRWSLLIAILNAGDPYLLSDPEDALWLGNILSDDVPGAFEHHANSDLRNRMRKMD